MLHVINGVLLMNHFANENLYYHYAPKIMNNKRFSHDKKSFSYGVTLPR